MSEDIWSRLVRVAARAPMEPVCEMPLGFDTRVLAAWRRGDGEDAVLSWVPLLRGALACSTVIMLVAVALNYQAFADREPTGAWYADSPVRMTLLP